MSDTTTVDPNDSMSLADHEQTFVHPESAPPAEVESEAVPESQPAVATDPATGERDEQGRFKPREKHRAKSQHATAADVPRIAELTRRRKEAEERAEAAEKRAQALEARLKTPAPAPKVEPPKEFTDAEPKYEDFANEADQYAAWMRATAAYDRKREAFEQQKTDHETRTKAEMEDRNRQRDEWFKKTLSEHSQRIQVLFESNPEAEAIIEKAGVELNDVELAAMISAENSAELALRLAQDPELVDDLHILTDGKKPSRELVAIVQRRMNRGLKAATTGSAAPAPVVPALPKPPNPVRTGAMKAADAPPGDDASLSEHERAYGTVGRRRR